MTSLMSESRQRRSIFFLLRGVLAVTVMALIIFHHALAAPALWFLGISFLVSNLATPFLPLSWFKTPAVSYGIFFFDMGYLTLLLYSVSGRESETLLLYYLTVFMATVGKDVRKSVAIGVVVGALYVWLRLNHPHNLFHDPEELVRIPLFFVTAVSCGYLAQELHLQTQRVRSLRQIKKGLEVEISQVGDDLEDSEQLLAAAEASERRFRNLLKDVDAIVWEMDAMTFQFTFVSQQAEQILGYPVERWLTELDFWRNHIHPEDRERVVALSRQATSEGRDFDMEYRATAQDNRIVWLRDLLRVVRDHDGRVRELRGVMVDITKLKKTEETLDRLRRQNELLLNSAGEGIYGIDLHGNTIFVNPAAARMLGWEPEELIGKAQHPIIHHTKADGTTCSEEGCPIYAALTDGAVRPAADDLFWRKDGSSFPVEYVSTPTREGDKVVGAVVVFKDITERRQLEAQLRQAQKMEAVGRLAGGIAHDFNNLLTIITGYSQLLLDRHTSGEELQEQIGEIKKAGNRAAALTRQLLAFSRKQVLTPRVVDLNIIIANVEKLLCRLIGEDIELKIAQAPELGRVRADPDQIEQVLLNLAINARDAMPHGGKLTIETANATLDASYPRVNRPVEPGQYVLLAVSDTGSGMSEEIKAHVFEPFFTTKEKGKGTGLGLAMVYGIVKQSGGYIWVYSELNRGTTFKIYLPFVEGAAENFETPKLPVGVPKGSETVLLVEDEDAVRSLVRGILESSGYAVIEASRPEEALILSQRHEGSIHLLVTDVVMPEMSGSELAKRLEFVFPDMKVLYVSGYTDEAIVHHGVLEPGTAFLQKPFTPDSLAWKVRQVLDT